MAFIVRFMNPFKTLQFLQDYMEAIRVLQAHNSVQNFTQNSSKDGDQQLYKTVSNRLRLANIFVIIELMHYAYKWLSPDPQDPIVVILNVDLIRMIQMKNDFQIQALLFHAIMHFYYNRMLFVNYHPFFLSLYYDGIFYNKMDNIFLTPLRYRGKSIEKLIKRNILYTIRAMQLFPLGIHLFLLFLQINGLVAIVSRGDYFDNWHLPVLNWPIGQFWATTIGLIYFELCWSVIAFGFYYLAYIGTLLFMIMSLGLSCGFTIFGQCLEWCRTLGSTKVWLAKRLTAMLSHNRRSLVLLLQQTTYFSNALLVFMAFNAPLNCYVLGSMLFGNTDPDWIPMLILFMSHQWMVIFGCHIMGVRINLAPFKPNKILLNLAARRRLPARTTLTLGLYLETFHTDKHYGFGYGKLGIITMRTFAKSVLLYLEFIMYAYMIVTQ